MTSSSGQVSKLPTEGLAYPFAVDSHLCVRVDAKVLDLWDVPDALHVRCVATRTEDDRDTGGRLNVRGGDKGTSRVVDNSRQLNLDFLS
jgi:hypothetical protein